MERRRFLRNAGAGIVGVSALAGCRSPSGDDEGPTRTDSGNGTTTGAATTTSLGGTLRVATYSSFTGEGTAGNWLKSAFESKYPDATVEFTTPENGLNQYVQRANEGAPIDADLYVGSTPANSPGPTSNSTNRCSSRSVRTSPVPTASRAASTSTPRGVRFLRYGVHQPGVRRERSRTARDLRRPASEPEYEGDLIVQNAQQSDPGRAFLLWTILAKDVDGYLDYWQGLQDNGVTIMSDWEPAYEAYMNDEAPMIVSYSTDQVYYHGEDVDMAKHQVGFLEDQGYANPEALAMFSSASNGDLGRRFVEFVLSEEAQAEIAERNVQFPPSRASR